MANPIRSTSKTTRIKLRQYQLDAVDAVDAAIRERIPGSRNMLVLPTGAGKTHVISRLVKMFPGHQILIITPRIRLLEQVRQGLGPHGVLSGSIGNDLGNCHRVIICTFQTVTHRLNVVIPSIIIIDECHLVPPGSEYAAFLDRYPNAAVIGLTATPFRGETHISECGLEWKLIFSVSITQLIDDHHLVPPHSMATSEESIADGNDERTLSEVTEKIIPALTASVRKEKRKKCLAFCCNIEHAKLTADLLKKAGETSVYLVHSHQKKKEQDAQFLAFKTSPERAWLVNVGLVTIGVDIPSVDCIAILRDIGAFALLVQIIGRGLRPWDKKQNCLIYDFGGGTRRFGFVDDPQFGCKDVNAREPAMKTCPKCGRLVHISAMTCPRCMHTFQRMTPQITSLSASAVASQLLSQDYIVATYQQIQILQDDRGLWQVEHHLTANGEKLRALETHLNRPTNFSAMPTQGNPILVKRWNNDIVQMVNSRGSS